MAKITPVLWKHKQNKQGKAPVYLRISDTDKTRYVSLRIYLRESHWNERSGRVRKSHNDHETLNALIARRVSEAQVEIMQRRVEGQSVTVDALKATLTPQRSGHASTDFFAFADQVVDDFGRRGKIGSQRRYRSNIKKFRAFTGEPLAFDEITPKLLRQYDTHLVEHYGNGPNTVASNMKGIRTIFYRGIREGLLPQEKNPFFQVKIKTERAERAKLTIEQIKALEVLDLEAGSLIWHVRNYWQRRVSAAQRRFLRAVESLARVRKLSSRRPLQVNIAQQQVNVAGWGSARCVRWPQKVSPCRAMRGAVSSKSTSMP